MFLQLCIIHNARYGNVCRNYHSFQFVPRSRETAVVCRDTLYTRVFTPTHRKNVLFFLKERKKLNLSCIYRIGECCKKCQCFNFISNMGIFSVSGLVLLDSTENPDLCVYCDTAWPHICLPCLRSSGMCVTL